VTVYCECTCDLVPLLSHPPAFFLFISLYFSNCFVNFLPVSILAPLLMLTGIVIFICRSSRNGDILSITRDWQYVGHRGQTNCDRIPRKRKKRKQTKKKLDLKANYLTIWTRWPHECCFFFFFFYYYYHYYYFFLNFSCLKFRWIATTTCFLVYKCTVKLHSLYISPSKSHSSLVRSGCCSLFEDNLSLPK
jgi:hypothetical protein